MHGPNEVVPDLTVVVSEKVSMVPRALLVVNFLEGSSPGVLIVSLELKLVARLVNSCLLVEVVGVRITDG